MKTRRIKIWMGVVCLFLVLVMGLFGACTKEPAAPTSTPMATPAEQSETITLRLANQNFPAEPISLAIDDFAASFNNKAGVRAEIVVFSGGSLGMSNQYLDMLRTGAVDMGLFPLGVVEEDAPVFTAPSLPFLFNSAAARAAALEPMAEAVFNGVFESQFDQKPVGWTATAVQDIGSAEKQIKTMEDLEGMLIAAASAAQFSMLKYLGAAPVEVPGPEIYGSIEKGVVDGVLMPAEAAVVMNLSEVMHYWTVCQMHTGIHCLNVSLDTFNKLPADLQSLLLEEGKLFGKAATEAIFAAEEASAENLKQSGMEFYTLTAAERNRWEEACHPMWDEFIAKTGAEGETLIAIAKEANQANP